MRTASNWLRACEAQKLANDTARLEARMNRIDLTDRAEILEVVAVLVDAMRRSDPEYAKAHGASPCSDDDWDAAIEAGEDCLEANG